MGDVKPFLSLEAIRAKAKEVPTRDVYVPEWGGTVRIKALTNNQLAAYSDEMEDKNKKRIANVVLTVWSAINEDGSALFPVQMIEELSNSIAGPFNLIAKEALDLNGVTKKAVDDAKNESGGEAPAANDSVLH